MLHDNADITQCGSLRGARREQPRRPASASASTSGCCASTCRCVHWAVLRSRRLEDYWRCDRANRRYMGRARRRRLRCALLDLLAPCMSWYPSWSFTTYLYVSRRAYVFHIAGQERMSIVPRGSCFRNQTSGLMFRKHESNPADALQTTWQTSQLSLLLSPAHLRAVHLLPAPASLFSDSYGISLLVGLQASQVRSPAPPPSSVAHPQAVSSSCYLLCLCKSVHVSWILPHGVRP